MLRKLVYKTFTQLAGEEVSQLEHASHKPRAAQLERLEEIVARGKNTAFGRDRGFRSIHNYEDFKSAVPIADYEQFRPYVDRIAAGEQQVLTNQNPFMLATTSGTMGKQKLIPVTRDYIDEFRRASKVSCFHLYRHFPQLANGRALSIVSPAVEGRTTAGIPYGAISGALYLMEPEPVRNLILSVPYEVFTIKDYETRYYCILRAAMANPVTSIYTLNPSTIAVLARRLQQYGRNLVKDLYDGTLTPPEPLPKSILDKMASLITIDRKQAKTLEYLLDTDQCRLERVWPELRAVSCWTKAAAKFYLSDLADQLGCVPICDITYGASEGRGTVFLSPEEQMLAIRSHFYEFIPEAEIQSANPTVLLADELTIGANYYILFSTSSGLYRYNINDVVKVTGFHNRTPLLEFQYKGGNIFSFSGEKVTELQVTESMRMALTESSLSARFFTVVPEFRPLPHYSLWFEPTTQTGYPSHDSLNDLAKSFDRQLALCNVEYAEKRKSFRLDPAEVRIIEPGSYEILRKTLVEKGVPDSQIKLSHLNPKQETREFFDGRLAQTRIR